MKHQPFWDSMEVEKLYSVYKSQSVTTVKVLNLLVEPPLQNQTQEEVWSYLRRFIGNMTVDELRTFLRFVTGSFVITVPLLI